MLSLGIFGAIGVCNLPNEWIEDLFRKVETCGSAEAAYRIRFAHWGIHYVAHLAGLDGKWQMYGGQSRFNWRYILSLTMKTKILGRNCAATPTPITARQSRAQVH